MTVRELIKELKQMPQDADIEIEAYGMDNEDWQHMSIHGTCNFHVGIRTYNDNVYIYAEEDEGGI